MNKEEQLEKFKEFCHSYAHRFLYCFSANTGEKYPSTFSKSHWGRFTDYFEDRYNITIKPTDINYYKIYEDIMVEEINKFIEQYKIEAIEKEKREKEEKKNKKKK